MELQFAEWLCLMEDRGTSAKSGLYPMGYGGIGNYPPADILTHSADAITYLDMDARLFKGWEAAPFSITHIPSTKEVIPPSGHGMPGKEKKPQTHGMPGKQVNPKPKLPPGKEVKPTSWVKLVTKPKLLDPRDF